MTEKKMMEKASEKKTALSQKNKKIDALIFIDTNVLLDFYRIRYSDVSMLLLDEIIKHKDLIITSNQVEMEFKKNRQIVLGESYIEFSKNRNINFNIPQILTNHEEAEKLRRAKKEIIEYQKALEAKFIATFTEPLNNDEVYQKLEDLFLNKSILNLTKDNEKIDEIIRRAKRRYELGCPPRKDKDNSIGDSVNWEWILECAKESEKSVIIISRDSDYGYSFNKIPYLNDYLIHEFNDQAGDGQQIILTDRLTEAFKLVQIPVTKEMVEEEQEIITWRNSFASINRMRDDVLNIKDAIERASYPSSRDATLAAMVNYPNWRGDFDEATWRNARERLQKWHSQRDKLENLEAPERLSANDSSDSTEML